MAVDESIPESDLIKYSDKILYYKNAIPSITELVADLDEYQEQYNPENCFVGPWEDWASNDDPSHFYGERRTGYYDSLENNQGELSEYDQKAKSIVANVKEAIESLARDYSANTDTVDYGSLLDTFQIVKYKEGEEMGLHYDRYPDSDKITSLSAVIYVNDNYEGGHIHFPDFDLAIKPEAGSVLFFPSTEDYEHESLAAHNGRKIMIPIFFYKSV
jgi:hypothetical protein